MYWEHTKSVVSGGKNQTGDDDPKANEKGSILFYVTSIVEAQVLLAR